MKLFNLEHKIINDIETISVDNEIFVIISLKKRLSKCPVCGSFSDLTHDYRQRTLNHAILNGKTTHIIYNRRRYRCTSCSKVFAENNPFVSSGRRLSRYTIIRIMKMLKDPRVTFSMVSDIVNISITSVLRIFDEYADISTTSFPTVLCIDEVYTSKYRQKVYACVLADFNTNQIYDLLPSRKKHELSQYFSSIPSNTRKKVTHISMDMWDTYRSISHIYFPNAKICVDSFHVISMINRAFKSVRVRVMNSFERNSDEYYLIKKYAWLLNMNFHKVWNMGNLHIYKQTPLLHYRRNVPALDILNTILSLDSELELAYTLKYDYERINSKSTLENIEDRLDRYIEDLTILNIKEFNPVKKALKGWRQEIINSFDTIGKRRISNGPIESINSRIKLIKYSSTGYGNFERFRKRVLYSLNDSSTIKA